MPNTGAINRVETQVLEGIRRTQDAVVKAVRSLAEAGKNIPGLRPIGDRLPDPTKLVDHGFALADRVLASQRRFALSLIDAVEPVLNGRSKPVAPAPVTPAARPRATTTKATATA
jgi:hypothetical protein